MDTKTPVSDLGTSTAIDGGPLAKFSGSFPSKNPTGKRVPLGMRHQWYILYQKGRGRTVLAPEIDPDLEGVPLEIIFLADPPYPAPTGNMAPLSMGRH